MDGIGNLDSEVICTRIRRCFNYAALIMVAWDIPPFSFIILKEISVVKKNIKKMSLQPAIEAVPQ